MTNPTASTRLRVAAAAELTRRLEAKPSFSFLRLGDGELGYLLRVQSTGSDRPIRPPDASQGTFQRASGGPRLTPDYYERLIAAFNHCSYLDLYASLPYNSQHLHTLEWARELGTGNEVPDYAQGIISDWFILEGKSYLVRHRTLICGAEAALLGELLKESQYLEMASSFFTLGHQPVILQPRRNGSFIAEDLDLIKADIAAAVREHQIDTIFVALGGGAKIICYEVARELNIRALDIGAVLRGLTYSGGVGYASWRANHHIHLVYVPFPVYMRALGRAHPELPAVEVLAKAHAQLCLELQHKEFSQSVVCDLNDGGQPDDSAEARKRFLTAFAYYRSHYRDLGKSGKDAERMVNEFDTWRKKRGIGWDGRLLSAGRSLKKALERFPGATYLVRTVRSSAGSVRSGGR